MENTSVSPVFSEAHDYSTGVFHYDGKRVNLLSRANSQPVHIYAVGDAPSRRCCSSSSTTSTRATWCWRPTRTSAAATFPDWTLMKPVFYQNKPVFFPAVRAHMIEVGGPVAGGYNSFARDVWQEGFRLSPIKICEKGEMRRDVLRMLSANNRLPDVMEGDLNAMIGACKVGEERILRLVEKYGLATVLEAVQYMLDYSERRVRAEIAQLARRRVPRPQRPRSGLRRHQRRQRRRHDHGRRRPLHGRLHRLASRRREASSTACRATRCPGCSPSSRS